MLHVFRIKESRRNCPRCGSAMTAMMIDDGKGVAAGGARLQWHMIPIADIDRLASNRFAGGGWLLRRVDDVATDLFVALQL